MSITARRGWQPGSHNRWLIAGAAAAVLVVVGGAIAAGLGSGIFNRNPIPGPVAVSPSPGASPAPSASPSPSPSPSPTATPSPTPPPSALAGLNCRLAISNGQAASGGWITFPGGAFTYDPESAVLLPGNANAYYGYGLTQDLALGKWVAVNRNWITPDGLRYVFPNWSYTANIEVVEKDGSTHLLGMPDQQGPLNILSAEPEGVYVDRAPGLLLVRWDGSFAQISTAGFWQAIGNGLAYGTASQSLPAGAANTIFARDLKTGATADVFTTPGMTSRVAGFGAGAVPVVEARSDTRYEIWLAGSPAVKLLSVDIPQVPMMGPAPGILSVLGDSHGTWIATSKALYLYTPAAGLEQASTVTGSLASNCR